MSPVVCLYPVRVNTTSSYVIGKRTISLSSSLRDKSTRQKFHLQPLLGIFIDASKSQVLMWYFLKQPALTLIVSFKRCFFTSTAVNNCRICTTFSLVTRSYRLDYSSRDKGIPSAASRAFNFLLSVEPS